MQIIAVGSNLESFEERVTLPAPDRGTREITAYATGAAASRASLANRGKPRPAVLGE